MGSGDRFATPNDKEIMEILDLLNDSDFDELRLEMPGLKLVFSKNMIDSPDQITETVQSPLSPEQVTPTESRTEPLKDFDGSEGPARHEEEGLVPIKAPLLGIFYRAPKPGAPPFVEVGDPVTEEDTVCLVEVMKLFNTVKSGVRGRIAKICAENSQMVEYNQILFLVDPSGNPEVS
jgi:acetyl-CoA carboxylase biotin carboxyl carrier protein